MDYRRPFDPVLVLTVGVLLLAGIAFVFSSSYHAGETNAGDAFFYLKRQGFALFLGILAFIAGFRLDFRKILDHPRSARVFPYFLLAACVVLVLVYVPGLGRTVSGSRRWIDLRIFQVQVSEVAKLLLLFYLAYTLPRIGEALGDFTRGFLKPMLFSIFVVVLIAIEPDLSSALLTFSVVAFLFYLAGTPLVYLITVSMAGLVGVIALMQAKPYIATRLLFFNPWLDPWGRGYHLLQSFAAFRNGGLFGAGPGNSVQKIGRLPEAHTDFVFSVIGEEIGLAGGLFIMALFVLFTWRGLRVALRQSDERLMLLAAGATAYVTIQAALHISVTLGLMPTSGLPLPFISYGRSDLITKLFLVGVLACLSRPKYVGESSFAGAPAHARPHPSHPG
jgi:cell division protein FtsW